MPLFTFTDRPTEHDGKVAFYTQPEHDWEISYGVKLDGSVFIHVWSEGDADGEWSIQLPASDYQKNGNYSRHPDNRCTTYLQAVKYAHLLLQKIHAMTSEEVYEHCTAEGFN